MSDVSRFHDEVIVWLNELSMTNDGDWRLYATVSNITTVGFTMHLDAGRDTTLFSARASWIAYPSDKADVVSGAYSTNDVRTADPPQLTTSGRIAFPPESFVHSPTVLFAINSLEIDHRENLQIKATVDSLSSKGMTWHLDGGGDTKVYSMGASYIAFA
ncbi:hypothetical protein AURDEDRAFT_77472 [Auricularia subglabra TFB-10046 SS5]|uniref:H-type lectin domain-containing protein n=1 Tax=Auricularia subglabra (strain TFB-10046 / SS5) TaxID=717982 RepID=J0WLV0_AURST|nr:hypothetical protein AURDEDRAFT_77472 [Auricularia subglabra TFB-10046 SS5]